jgi:predicted NUDIX family phosphoesterase
MEKVLCFSRFLLEDNYGWFDGVSFNNNYAHLVMNEHNYIFVERNQAENDKHYKQIIPYSIFVNEKGEIFNYKRGNGSGEDRLKNLRSIGIGGHINLEDSKELLKHNSVMDEWKEKFSHVEGMDIFCDSLSYTIYSYGLYREIAEEFGLSLTYEDMPKNDHELFLRTAKMKKDCMQNYPQAFINEEDTEVGKFHFGSVHIFNIIDDTLINRLEEDVIVDAQFSDYNEIMNDINNYEIWSQLCLDNWSKLEE